MGSNTSKEAPRESQSPKVDSRTEAAEEKGDDDDAPDDWDKRIFSTGCADEQTSMNDCYFEKKDWRACSQEMMAFRECWKRKGNDIRTATKDA